MGKTLIATCRAEMHALWAMRLELHAGFPSVKAACPYMTPRNTFLKASVSARPV